MVEASVDGSVDVIPQLVQIVPSCRPQLVDTVGERHSIPQPGYEIDNILGQVPSGQDVVESRLRVGLVNSKEASLVVGVEALVECSPCGTGVS